MKTVLNLKKSIALILLSASMSLTSAAAQADEMKTEQTDNILYAINFGILDHDTDNLWSGSKKEDGIDYNVELVFNHNIFNVWSGVARPNFGLSMNDKSGNASKLYGGLVWERPVSENMFFSIAFGIAVHDGEIETSDKHQKELGSRWLFRTGFEFGYQFTENHSLAIMTDHISNASIRRPNDGLDTLGLRYRYRF